MNKKLLLLQLALFVLSHAYSYADPVPSPLLPVSDYIRGTAGEPLFVDEMHLAGKFALRVENELRYCGYTAYWDTAGEKQDLDAIEYSRLTEFLSVDFGVADNVEIGARIPFVWMRAEERLTASNWGIGDLLLRVRAGALSEGSGPIRMTLGAGVKFPSGEDSGDLRTGTGSVDFPFMVYCSWDLGVLELHADMGYVITGAAKDRFNMDHNVGDVFLYDIALAREVVPPVSCAVEFNGYNVGTSRNDEGFKTDNPQHRFTISPGIRVSIPGIDVDIDGGFSRDLFGSNALYGTTPLLRMKVKGQVKL